MSAEMENQNEEIDLIELLKKVWDAKWFVLKTTLVCLLIGVFVAIFSKKQYTATTMVVPQTSSGSVLGSLGGLAAMAGINLGGTKDGEVIVPKLYPKIAQSIPFEQEMIKTPITIEGVGEVTYQQYYQEYAKPSVLGVIKKYTIGLPGVILSSFKGKKQQAISDENQEEGNKIYVVTEEEKDLYKQLAEQLSIDVNDKEGYINLSFTMEEPLAAAQMLQKAQEYLQNAITEIKIQKVQEQLTFIGERYEEARKDFEKKQMLLASFDDTNKGLISLRSQTSRTKLQSEYNLAYNVYSELAKQLESQKIKVKEDTPVFAVIEPVSVPIEKSAPKRGMILVVWTMVGFVIGVGMIFVKDFLKEFNQ